MQRQPQTSQRSATRLAGWRTHLAVIALLAAASGGALAALPSEPMAFTLHTPCEGCEPYLLAEGAIVDETPARFRDTLQLLRVRGQLPRIQFDSRGGSLQAGMRLGRMIREAGLDTYIGGPYRELVPLGEPARVVAQRPACYSACAYAFLGGVSRTVAEGGAYGLHQFFGADGDVGDSRTQVMMTVLAAYLDEMGVERRFLDLAATTTPDRITRLSPATARELNVDNQDPPRGTWRLAATDQGQLIASITQQAAGRDALVVMELRREDRRLVGNLRYRIRQSVVSEDELAEEFTVRGVPELRFRAANAPPGSPGVTVVAEGWRKAEDGWFATGFIVDPPLAELLAGTPDVEFSALPGSRVLAIAPRARLSTRGFASALKALER